MRKVFETPDLIFIIVQTLDFDILRNLAHAATYCKLNLLSRILLEHFLGGYVNQIKKCKTCKETLYCECCGTGPIVHHHEDQIRHQYADPNVYCQKCTRDFLSRTEMVEVPCWGLLCVSCHNITMMFMRECPECHEKTLRSCGGHQHCDSCNVKVVKSMKPLHNA